jgi:branched-subunit amino acid transport protein
MGDEITLAILLGAAVTCALRVVPIVLLAQMRLPAMMRDWLGFIPSAVLSALIAAEVLGHPRLSPAGWNLSLLAALAAAAAGLATRSLFATVAVGLGAFLGLPMLLG